jgi:hypothetical protein
MPKRNRYVLSDIALTVVQEILAALHGVNIVIEAPSRRPDKNPYRPQDSIFS